MSNLSLNDCVLTNFNVCLTGGLVLEFWFTDDVVSRFLVVPELFVGLTVTLVVPFWFADDVVSRLVGVELFVGLTVALVVPFWFADDLVSRLLVGLEFICWFNLSFGSVILVY